MNIHDLREAMRANNIEDYACIIFPSVATQLSYCLVREGMGYRVYLNEKGEFLADRRFPTEDEACRFALRKVLEDRYWRKDSSQIDPSQWPAMRREILRRNRFDPDEKVSDKDR